MEHIHKYQTLQLSVLSEFPYMLLLVLWVLTTSIICDRENPNVTFKEMLALREGRIRLS